ncbi:MAG: hypothetical protein OXC81_02415, partial [Betaproteobacteria bacterium]|nr:hypothetical protein [Betaproteobacteria bacterium]
MLQEFVSEAQSEIASRTGNAYLIEDTTYGIAQAAQDFLTGAGLGSDAYTFLDIKGPDTSSRSAYLSTPENSLVNILSNPLYIASPSSSLGGLIISPDDIQDHGWILSDTGFDGNLDPIAGISSRGWLAGESDSVAQGYRNALATGKVRLFYGLNSDGMGRNSSANGCQWVEIYCIGTPYSLRISNAQGHSIDVEGAFVSTYGCAAYLMSWQRLPEDTHVSAVFAIGDRCTTDLGDTGIDAQTGRGRLDIGCMAREVAKINQDAASATLTVAPLASKQETSNYDLTISNFADDGVFPGGRATITSRQSSAYLIDAEWSTAAQNKLVTLGVASGSYTSLDTATHVYGGRTPYLRTSQNSLVYMDVIFPFGDNTGGTNIAVAVKPADLVDHGWLLLNTGLGENANPGQTNPITALRTTSTRLVLRTRTEMAARYRKVVATGKARVFYGLDANETVRESRYNGCQEIESYCIGVPRVDNIVARMQSGNANKNTIRQSYANAYAFAVYLKAWERLPAATHISAVFALADRCVEDLGAPGPDADTGMGRLDIGCMAGEVLKVNMNPTSATLSVVARSTSLKSTPLASTQYLPNAFADSKVFSGGTGTTTSRT